MMVQGAAAELLQGLRWTADTDVIEYEEGEHVWLGPCVNEAGVRIGITVCCPVAGPCDRHKDMKPWRGN